MEARVATKMREVMDKHARRIQALAADIIDLMQISGAGDDISLIAILTALRADIQRSTDGNTAAAALIRQVISQSLIGG